MIAIPIWHAPYALVKLWISPSQNRTSMRKLCIHVTSFYPHLCIQECCTTITKDLCDSPLPLQYKGSTPALRHPLGWTPSPQQLPVGYGAPSAPPPLSPTNIWFHLQFYWIFQDWYGPWHHYVTTPFTPWQSPANGGHIRHVLHYVPQLDTTNHDLTVTLPSPWVHRIYTRSCMQPTPPPPYSIPCYGYDTPNV